MDAGALQIEATLSATLNATLRGAAEAGGRGAAVDISASKIAVIGGVDASSYTAAGYLVLDAASLSAFGGESLLLGGMRRQTVSGLEVDATAGSIVVATDGTEANALVAPEILLVSEDVYPNRRWQPHRGARNRRRRIRQHPDQACGCRRGGYEGHDEHGGRCRPNAG